MELISAVTQVPILVPSTMYKMALPPLPICIPAVSIESKMAFTAVDDCITAVISAPMNIRTIGSKKAGLILAFKAFCSATFSFSAPLQAEIIVRPKKTRPKPAAVSPQLFTLPFLHTIATKIPTKASTIK